MAPHETWNIEELSDEKRCLLLDSGQRWIYRQPGGCVEIGAKDDAQGAPLQDLIHICEESDVKALIEGLQAILARVPARF